jgi:hypothetical protein
MTVPVISSSRSASRLEGCADFPALWTVPNHLNPCIRFAYLAATGRQILMNTADFPGGRHHIAM